MSDVAGTAAHRAHISAVMTCLKSAQNFGVCPQCLQYEHFDPECTEPAGADATAWAPAPEPCSAPGVAATVAEEGVASTPGDKTPMGENGGPPRVPITWPCFFT